MHQKKKKNSPAIKQEREGGRVAGAGQGEEVRGETTGGGGLERVV